MKLLTLVKAIGGLHTMQLMGLTMQVITKKARKYSILNYFGSLHLCGRTAVYRPVRTAV